MLEMECTNLTPSSVLEASGHVERFTDFMVKDDKTGECFRADKLLEDVIDNYLQSNPQLTIQEQEVHRLIQRQADAYDADELYNMLMKYNTKSPTNPQNDITRPFPFNLMFKTTIGPEGTQVGYLRPETAQGLFVNFKRLLDYNQGKMPFAAAQIGLGFRNEIAPRNGLLRVREFCMAEIEHFVDPKDKSYPKFNNIANKEVILFPADAQLGSGRTITITIGEAVASGLINNQTLGYFMARTQIFLERIGINKLKMRFRQHLKTEMAHYAADCWDLEIKLVYGWIECVGHADRSCYDLQQHSSKTGIPLLASQRLNEPIYIDKVIVEPNKKLIGPLFKTNQKIVLQLLENLSDEALVQFKAEIETTGKSTVSDGTTSYEITKDLVSFVSENKAIHEVKFVPSVIEPSYGIGRILYSVFEHSFSQRSNDESRCVMSFKPCVAPIKVGIYRLINNIQFDPIVKQIYNVLQSNHISNKVDSSSGTVGRRYSRADELGIPFGITIDFQTLVDDSITLRERDSMEQIRLPINKLLDILIQLINESLSWSKLSQLYPLVESNNDEEDEEEAVDKPKDVVKTTTTSPTLIQHHVRAAFSRPNPAFVTSSI
eukprot:CAMPEP_0196765264 /NCGR_PEP_ID=MMETSP1095-20130614/7914_1 /TAXON_ID=96789 ORGANISM="Chromulina nebulosa, Strain UTEXLB2642" /NCGR_SAMPLE_ID=MMETSP1095 /ASSEMBLY_ACC=CAM_ASM_000446 /LENGTH=602 /DNA_ID=CAMNT_0042123027 /DNA_START=295 /DNA_END=2103 /DNA_ORIENTATION=-